MARPSNKAGKQPTPDSISIPSGFAVEAEYKVRSPEDEDDRFHRHRMEVRSFWLKEASVYLVALLILLMTTGYCFSLLWNAHSAREDRQWGMSIITSVLVGIVGYLFGKFSK